MPPNTRAISAVRRSHRRPRAGNLCAMRPLLFVDIDGVLNPYAAKACPSGYVEHDLFPYDDEPVRVCQAHAVWLRELSGAFELVWGSSWSSEDRQVLGTVLELPRFSAAV